MQSWLQSEMFISNSVDMMKNLHEERTENLLVPDNIIKFLKHFMNIEYLTGKVMFRDITCLCLNFWHDKFQYKNLVKNS